MSRVIKSATIIGEGPKLIESPPLPYKGEMENEEITRDCVAEAAAYAVVLEEQKRKAAKLVEEAEIQCNAMLDEAKQKAEEIIVQANQAALEIKEKTCKEASEKGYAEGHDHGYKAAREEMEIEVNKANEKAQRIISFAENDAKDAVLKAEKQIVDIALAIAQKVIPQHMIDTPQLICPLVRDALEKVKDQSLIKVKVAPGDYELVLMAKNEFQTVLESDSQLEITPDSTIEPGGCIVESDNGNVDARLSTKMEAVKKAIQEVG